MRGASHSHGTKPCLPLMCLGPLGIGRPTTGSPRRGCSHWAPHQSATSCIEPCRCHCPWPSSTDCTFCRRHLCVSCRKRSSRWVTGVQAWLDRDEKMSDNACLSYRKSSGPLQKVHCAGGRGPGANGIESSTKVSWDRVVEHGRDLRCCIAPRRFPSDGRHASSVASCLRFRRFRQPRRAEAVHGWKHLRVLEEGEAWEFERAQMLHEDGELFDDVKKAEAPRAREAPATLRFPSFLAWRKRWCRMLSVSCSRAFCGFSVSTAEDQLIGTNGAAPELADLFATVLSTAMVFSCVDTSPAVLFSSVSEKKKPGACCGRAGRG